MVLRDVSKPTCGPNDVLIRVHYAGVCGTDCTSGNGTPGPAADSSHLYASAMSLRGKSCSWESEATEAGLLAIGDLVTAEGHIVCGHCLPCRTGDFMSSEEPRLSGWTGMAPSLSSSRCPPPTSCAWTAFPPRWVRSWTQSGTRSTPSSREESWREAS